MNKVIHERMPSEYEARIAEIRAKYDELVAEKSEVLGAPYPINGFAVIIIYPLSQKVLGLLI